MSALNQQQRFRRDHRWARERMSEFLDGELAAARITRMEQHLGECEECRRLLAGLHQTVAALHRLSTPGGLDPAQLAGSIVSQLASQR